MKVILAAKSQAPVIEDHSEAR